MASKKTGRSDPAKRTQRGRGATKGEQIRTTTRVWSALDKQIEERFERLFVRLIWRLGLASQKDVGGLSQRIDHLERRLRSRRSTPHLKAVPRKPPAPSPPESGSPASGNSAA